MEEQISTKTNTRTNKMKKKDLPHDRSTARIHFCLNEMKDYVDELHKTSKTEDLMYLHGKIASIKNILDALIEQKD